ncbi:hypothetical protein RHGRI_031206 [Rhododendron griersonianum]|uniref:Ubiquinol oxidase n=1 Tax=Rhododendron griersonianum TaxID=479676 RepID=A0AAV6ICU3_9ERIC|nr:hypothetical protein RHGRI_031206 [Rhododendron griersonianum]
MMSRGATGVIRSVVGPPRCFSTAAVRTIGTDSATAKISNGAAGFFPLNPGKASERAAVTWIRFPVMGARNASTVALDAKEQKEEEKVGTGSAGGVAGGTGGNDDKAIPWETYKANVEIDLKKHHVPVTFLDKVAFWTVKSLRYPTDLFFQSRYGCRAMMLETVAAVPGMVGGMLLHCKSLRRFEHSGGWIKTLLEEAENERMHLMTFMEVAKPRWYERALVFAVQGVFFNAYFLGYLVSPKFAHRVTGYLEEEAIHSYTEFLKELDAGRIENVPAPAIAVDYWQLPPEATLRDVVVIVRADEAHHRDVNHFASDIHYQGHELKEAPAPLGYH